MSSIPASVECEELRSRFDIAVTETLMAFKISEIWSKPIGEASLVITQIFVFPFEHEASVEAS